MWDSFKIAFSMYSKIPMPNTEWNKKTMKYAICFFPMVGFVIGLIMYLWFILSEHLAIGNILRTAIYVTIPIVITGGIHIDGFVDTMDAINSYQPIERKLEILKDSHIGAFALIGAITYFILDFGVWSEAGRISVDAMMILGIGFILSRSLSGYSIATFKCAKDSGLARTFADAADKKIVSIIMIVYIVVCSILMIIIDVKMGIIAVICALLTFIYYKNMSMKKFGGITGDLAGFFLQTCELLMAAGVVILSLIW